MVIKTFRFPSFKKWKKTQEYTQKIGEYSCDIAIIMWGHGHNSENEYIAILANSHKTMNIYSRKIFIEKITCSSTDKRLEEWYKEVTIKINNEWKKFILETYFCSESN